MRKAIEYMDHPPLSIFILTLARGLLVDSLFAIRFLSTADPTLLSRKNGRTLSSLSKEEHDATRESLLFY